MPLNAVIRRFKTPFAQNVSRETFLFRARRASNAGFGAISIMCRKPPSRAFARYCRKGAKFYKRHYTQISHAPLDRSAVMRARKRYCRDSRGVYAANTAACSSRRPLVPSEPCKAFLRVSRHIFLCTLTAAKHHASVEWGRHRAQGGEESDCTDNKRVGHKNRSFRVCGRSVPLQLALPTDISYRRQVLLPNLRVSLRGGVCG